MKRYKDDAFILDMLIPLGVMTTDEIAAKTGSSLIAGTDIQPHERFTCRHFDGKNCRVYETRPSMCRTYGVMTNCEYESCTLRTDGNKEQQDGTGTTTNSCEPVDQCDE